MGCSHNNNCVTASAYKPVGGGPVSVDDLFPGAGLHDPGRGHWQARPRDYFALLSRFGALRNCYCTREAFDVEIHCVTE